jgi:phospholipid/cholesterol/gamma-HCH transport system substrate-binding protein
MNGDKRSSNIKLGAFVAAGTMLLVAALFYLGQQRNKFGNTMPLSVMFTDVKGLQAGNSVQFMGINAGTVKRIVILSPTTIRVDMVIEKEISSFIKTDATAQIGTEGLMGNKIVSIRPATSDAASVEAGGMLQSRPGMAVDSLFESLQLTSAHAQQMAQNLAEITGQIRKGDGLVGSLLMDTIMAKKLEKTIDQLQVSSEQTRLLMTDLNRLVQQVNQGQGPIGMLLTDSLANQDLKEAIGQIKVISRQSAQLSGELLKVSKHLNSDHGMAQTLLRDTVFAGNVEKSLMEIREGSQKFNENMEALQHNFLLRRYFRKKASK